MLPLKMLEPMQDVQMKALQKFAEAADSYL
jgi:hypothetical protein